MKLKALLLSIVFLMSGYIFAQQVDRENVLLEIVTGTWCYYCPGAAMGAEDLVANGKQVAVIEYHTGDNYENAYSGARSNYYNVSGVPSAFFDGVISVVGGNHTSSMYGSYLPKYNQRIAIQSPFTIEAEGTNGGLIDYNIIVTVNKVAANSSSNLKLMCALTESGIQQSWQGQNHLEWVERLMAPNQFGTSLDFTSGNTLEIPVNFTMESSWVNENCEVVFFVQDLSTKEVFQTVKYDISEFASTNDYDVSLKDVYVPQAVCNSSIEPSVFVTNFGLLNLTSFDVVYSVNGGTQQTYSWTGNLANSESALVDLPAIDVSVAENNTIDVTLENPNGQADQFPQNNSKTLAFDEAIHVTSPVILALKLDDNPGETTWELKDSQGTVLYSGGPYTTAGQYVIEYFELGENGCYSFSISDAGGDGLTGAGSYKLAYDGSTIFAQGYDFGYMSGDEFKIGITGEDELNVTNSVQMYPNPFTETAYVSFSTSQTETVSVNVYNSIGKLVYTLSNKDYSAGTHTITIDGKELNSGMYFVNLKIGENSYKQKLVLTK
jgi:hypothetical protein